jgi:hypothetical protein
MAFAKDVSASVADGMPMQGTRERQRSPGFFNTKFRNDTIPSLGVIPKLFLEESGLFFEPTSQKRLSLNADTGK